jgi:predicted double-glycine peptidase
LDKNPETVDFVEAYGEKKEIASPEVIEELKEGEIPRLIQWDERWGYAPYGTGIIAVCGCGPTALSMVLSGLTGDNTLTPEKLAEYGTEHNYLNEKNDTMWSYMTEVCKEWGVNCREAMLDKTEALKQLNEGHPIVCSVGPGDFTQNGHFIVLAGVKDDELIVHDPFSIVNSEKTWKFEDIQDQIKVMWVYSK